MYNHLKVETIQVEFFYFYFERGKLKPEHRRKKNEDAKTCCDYRNKHKP